MIRYKDVRDLVRAAGLDIFGGFHPTSDDEAPAGTRTLLLLGPHEPGFWNRFRAEPEYLDGMPDPLDRWSDRVISGIADETEAQAVFPFGGPPWHPFIAWAKKSGHAWASPVTLLVHDRAGLMVSYRGALAFDTAIDLPPPGTRPCDTCADQPCRTACPVTALTPDGYDVPACKAHLSTDAGKRTCMAAGCLARRACPVSNSYGRDPEQSAYHMSRFHP